MDAEELVVEEAQVAELLQQNATATEPEPSSEWFQVVALVGSHHLPAVQAPSPLQLQMAPLRGPVSQLAPSAPFCSLAIHEVAQPFQGTASGLLRLIGQDARVQSPPIYPERP